MIKMTLYSTLTQEINHILRIFIIGFYFFLTIKLDQYTIIHDFNKALEKYIKLSALHPSHFESEKIDYNEDFYHWALKYIINRDEFNWRLKYLKVSHCDFQTQVNLFFDILYLNDINLYENIIGKVKNAWYQHIHQKKNANKKKYLFILSDKTLNELENLQHRFNCSQEKILERLIAAEYLKECLNAEGKPKYTLND